MDDKELNDRPQVLWKGVGTYKGPPRTTGPTSAFAVTDVKHIGPRTSPPKELKLVPAPVAKRVYKVSPWKAVYDGIPEGQAIELSKAQAMTFASWGRSHKQKLHRSRIEGTDNYLMWRPAESYQSKEPVKSAGT